MSFNNTLNLNNSACADQVNYLLFRKPLAGLKMLDAWGKLPDGLLAGQFTNYGAYDECLNISETSPNGPIKGKYCLVGLSQIYTTFIGLGTCIPDACEFNPAFAAFTQCQIQGVTKILDVGDYIFIGTMSILGIILLLSTIYDWYTRKNKAQPNQYLILFSLLTNGEKLFETKIAVDQISCLAGMRVISMIWIMASHRYYMLRLAPVRNSLYGFSFMFSHASAYIQAAYLAVDTFLFISGFVVAYQCFKNRNQMALSIPTIPIFYMHRLLRLLPIMTFVYFIHTTILRRLGTGPLYNYTVEAMRVPCLESWWPYFLFVQNYVFQGFRGQCLSHTWYMSVDFQLYFFTPIILIPATKLLLRNQLSKCYYLLGFALILSILIPMGVMFEVPYVYTKTHTRISPYIMGLITGLFILENRNKVIKIPIAFYYLIWLFALTLAGICIFYIQDTMMFTDRYLFDNMFITFGRPAWSFFLSWIIFCCENKNTKLINKFLSNALFIVLGRLSYAMYMLQMVVIIITMGTGRTPPLIQFWTNLHGSVADIFIITLVSIAAVLAFESPVIGFAKLLLSKNENRIAKNR